MFHLAAYQDYLTDFARFSDVNVVSTALLYEIIVAEHLDLARIIVASSQAAMGEGLYECAVHGEQLPGMRPSLTWRRANGTSAVRSAVAHCSCGPHPNAVSNPQNAYGMSKLGQEMVAVNLGRRYGVPDRCPALQHRAGPGPVRLQRLLRGLPHILPALPAGRWSRSLYEDGEAIRDYVNIEDVVDANVLVLEDDRASGQVFNVGGASRSPRASSPMSSGASTDRIGQARSPASTGSETHATSCPTSAPSRHLGWAAPA